MKNQIEQFKADVSQKGDADLKAWLDSLKVANPASQEQKEVNTYMIAYIMAELEKRSGSPEAEYQDTTYVITRDFETPTRNGVMRYVAGQPVEGTPSEDGQVLVTHGGVEIPMAYIKIEQIEREIEGYTAAAKATAMKLLGSRNAYVAVSWGGAAALIGLMFGRNIFKTGLAGAIGGLAYEHFLRNKNQPIPPSTQRRIEKEEDQIRSNARGRGAGFQDIGTSPRYKTAKVPDNIPDGSPCTINGKSGVVSGGICYVGGVTNKPKKGRGYRPVRQPRRRNKPAYNW